MKPNRFYFRTTSIFGAPLKCGAPVFIGFTFLISGLGAHGGDILRGGGGNSNKPGRASAGAPTPAATDAARANARDTLNRTNRTLDAVRAMQIAARNAAIKSGANHLGKNPNNLTVTLPQVPNGLIAGGLQVAPVVATDPTKWTGAKLPTQIVKGGKTQVTIKQTTQQALLNWQSFNVGKKTTVTFDQSKGGADVSKWIAFNKISDPTGNPTQILGKIKADGQVYLINPNGIIFGGSSQVNARGLTVSSLPINENLLSRGLLNNPDAQFLFSGLDIPAGVNGTPAFTPEKPLSADGKFGDITVMEGAVLESPTNSAKVGGRVTLVGPNVFNRGSISTPDGQTILAAGLQVGFEGHATSDPSLRGLDVFVGAVSTGTGTSLPGLYAGTVKQSGIIEARRGSITIAGREVEQTGALASTTSVSLNGRIEIQANYNAIANRATSAATGALFLYKSNGTVNLGADSVISILPEYESKETTIGTELALRSQINISGKNIRVGESSTLYAPNGLVSLSAGTWLFQEGTPPVSKFVQSGGQVYLEKGSLIDVAGSIAVPVPVAQNIVSVDLRGAELADSPLQREGNLRGKSVQIDIRDTGIYQGDQWLGTPLADVAGFANLIQRSIGQLTTKGGSVTISAGKSVVTQEGSKIDVSGGSTLFEAGMVKTTQLLTGDGRLVDISLATPDVVYEGIYDGTFTDSNVKFGVTNVFSGALAPGGFRLDPGSTEGAAGGSLSISSPSMALDGRFLGQTVTGEKQRLAPPSMSSLTLKFQAQDVSYPSAPVHSPTPPTITFDAKLQQVAAGPFTLDANGDAFDLSPERKERVVLSSDLLSKDGFGSLTVDNRDGTIVVPEKVTLKAPTGGSVNFNASNITVEGGVIARGGKLTFSSSGRTLDEINSYVNSGSQELPVIQPGRGIFTLGAGGVLSTAGLLVDDRLTNGKPQVSPVYLKGGEIRIASYTANLAEGGLVDVSGGASLGATGSVSYGSGGLLTVAAGREIGSSSILGGKLSLGADLLGLSGGKAGSLALTAPAFQIGGATSNPGVTIVRPGFFSAGGFGSIALSGTGLADSLPGEFIPGIRIVENTEIRPVVKSWLGSVNQDNEFKLSTIIRDEGVRSPISLSFAAIGATFNGVILARGDVVMGKGSLVQTDGLGSVSFGGPTITLLGKVIVPGGDISVTGPSSYPSNSAAVPAHALPTVHLGGNSLLSTKGKVVLLDNAFDLRQGSILAGGSINVFGNIVAESGAVLDVSGARGVLDLPPASKSLEISELNSLEGKVYVPVTIESNGGAITLIGSEMLFSDATLRGQAGGESAIGGTLSVTSGKFVPVGTVYTTADANLVVTQDGVAVPDTNSPVGVGNALLDSAGNIAPQLGRLAVDSFEDGGFDSLSLGGNVRFEGGVTISMPGSLRVADGGVVYSDSKINLSAGHVALGQAFRSPSPQQGNLFNRGIAGSLSPYFFGPEYGAGKLTVRANLIDVGNLSLQGIGNAALIATEGDVRGNGTLQVAGDLLIKAGQVYPTTRTAFKIFAYDHTSTAGSVTILKGQTRSLPYSAGGTLSIYASDVTQSGSLRAPLGTINLGWDGTGTMPTNPIAGSSLTAPVTANLSLASSSITSVSAFDPFTKKAAILPYGISFDGSSWIDPAGNDITSGGAPEKRVNLSALDLKTEQGSSVDIRGGGDLYAYRWISGNGGTKDVLASENAFAVIPGYGFDYAPYAPFNTDSSATKLGGQPGYTNSTLKVGDQITLADSKGLPAGTYTLLPARYALLPGAYLVTPLGGSGVNPTGQADGSKIVSGYRSNNLDQSRTGATTITRFEIAGYDVVRQRSQYQDLLATTVLSQSALARDLVVPRLPGDSGYLSFSSTVTMSLDGGVLSAPGKKGRGGLIDINSSSDILINKTGGGGASGQLVLKASQLNDFGAESVLIGGVRAFGPGGAEVTVNTDNLELSNEGAALIGSDIILVSNGKLTLAKNSEITTTQNKNAVFDTLLLGDDAIAGSGNGGLVRVSSNATGGVIRLGVSGSNPADLDVRSGVELSGGYIVLDSTSATSLAKTARLNAKDLSLSSGQISLVLNKPGTLGTGSGLVLAGDALTSLQSSAKRLSLLSYSSLDVYGRGTVGTRDFESLVLQAAAIRGFNTGAGTVKFTASNLILGNSSNIVPSSPISGTFKGTLLFDADNITLGANRIRLDGFSKTALTASDRILVSGEGGIEAAGDLDLVSQLLTGESASKYRIAAGGLLQVRRPSGAAASMASGGFGTDLTLEGAAVKVDGDITLPSGKLSLRALTGDVVLGDKAAASINLEGTSLKFVDVIRYTSGGQVNLDAAKGSVRIEDKAGISVSAKDGGGNAGSINVVSPDGTFELNGLITGSAGSKGLKGSFSLDAGSIAAGSLAGLDAILNAGSFNFSRGYRIRTGDVKVDGLAKSHIYRVSADAGAITVSKTINASGFTGGIIDLKANGSLILSNGALLDASGSRFDSAGKGGSITLEAGNQRNGVVDSSASLDLQSGSTIDLSVSAAEASSEASGKFTGTLHLRAPRNDANTDLQVNAIGSSVKGASSILVEGVKLYGLTGTGTITTTVQNTIKSDANSFLGAAGVTTAGYTAMRDRLTALHPTLDLILAPGAEIHNAAGGLVLGTTTSTATSDWNLQTFRFGPKSAPGVLTLRALGDIVFYNALSDGFAAVTPNSTNGQSSLWLAPLMARNALLPANAQSWSYRLTSGADLSSADFRAVLPESALAADKGSFLLGKNYGNAATYGSGGNFTTATAISGRFQVIRTGSGDITINAGRNAYILNQFASIYSAGTLVTDPATVLTSGDFAVPFLLSSTGRHPNQGPALGAVQQRYFVQYSMAGGNISIHAGADLARMTRNSNSATGGILIDDSSRQLPNHWLFRRGFIDPSTGRSGVAGVDDSTASITDPDASTTWWVDFSNFFEGIGTLGGGNISLSAGRDLKNLDAVAPTNARMAGGVPSFSAMVELGGGDVSVTAGRNIDGGVYYVERGKGSLVAGGEITTNSTRSPSRGIIDSLTNPSILNSKTWLPTTFFVGKGGFDVQSAGNLTVGPALNTFLLPQGLNNKFWYKTYFNSFGADSYLHATSLGGDVTLRSAATTPSADGLPVLAAWSFAQYYLSAVNSPASFQPWLRLAESEVDPFRTVSSVSAPNLLVSALDGNIDVVGDLTLFPSKTGQLELIARDSVTGLQPTGPVGGRTVERWIASTINLSDSDPGGLPGITSPYAYLQVVGRSVSAQRITGTLAAQGFLEGIDSSFVETGSTNGVLQDEQKLHTAGTLHRGDTEPLRIYALGGNIEGLTLFSPKSARVAAGKDIGDVALYLQNISSSDISIVSAGKDIILYNPNTASRIESNKTLLVSPDSVTPPMAGDIQVSGPGNLQVLAGRNLNLGLGSGNSDGTGSGITSIGNARNPYLPFRGANLMVAAGVGPAASLSASTLQWSTFIKDFVAHPEGLKYVKEIDPDLDFESLSEEEQAQVALQVFYFVLRDTGKARNDPKSKADKEYKKGRDAIESLFGKGTWDGEILTQSRDIRTRSGGDISILAPGGGLTLANTTIGNPLTPPGIVTEFGGKINIFTDQNVDIGIGRIFTLRGGDQIIWSTNGNIAAGSSSRTVSSAPPTRVLIDPQSGAVQTDLAGLATGGGIGALAAVKSVKKASITLVAPKGEIDAGDAGINATGNITVAAVSIVNAANISAGGTSSGTPSAPSAPTVSTVTSASNASAAVGATTVNPENKQAPPEVKPPEESLSLITVEVIGYGGGGAADEEEDEEERRRKAAEAAETTETQ